MKILRNGRRSSKRDRKHRALWFRTLKWSRVCGPRSVNPNKICLHDLPHPDPLPKEREQPRVIFRLLDDGFGISAARHFKDRRTILLLLGRNDSVGEDARPHPPGRGGNFRAPRITSPCGDSSQRGRRKFPLLGERARVRASRLSNCIVPVGEKAGMRASVTNILDFPGARRSRRFTMR